MTLPAFSRRVPGPVRLRRLTGTQRPRVRFRVTHQYDVARGDSSTRPKGIQRRLSRELRTGQRLGARPLLTVGQPGARVGIHSAEPP